MRVLHVITGLGTGGAENHLLRLVRHTHQLEESVRVVSVTPHLEMAEDFDEIGVAVDCLDVETFIDLPTAVLQLRRMLRRTLPDVVMTWMHAASLVGSLASWRSPQWGLVWNVRQANLDTDMNERHTILAARLLARLSHRMPDRILANSEAAARSHVDLGFDDRRLEVIPNGFDLESFRPSPALALHFRSEYKIPDAADVVGFVGRDSIQKAPEIFSSAAAEVLERRPDAFVVACGHGLTSHNEEVAGPFRERGVSERVRLLGPVKEISAAFAAMDVLVSSSRGESFPNVLGEAMACGVPCVVTNVGASAEIVGETGIVVPPGDVGALVSGIEEILDRDSAARRELGKRARERIGDRYDIDKIAARYRHVALDVTEGRR